MNLLFPINDFWPVYLGFIAFVILMLLLDLGVFHKNAHRVSAKEAAAWSIVWVSLALIFNGLLYFYSLQHFGAITAKEVSLEFLTGFVIEKSLAVDNIFVFIIVFGFFQVPEKYQHRILFYGVLGALVFRAALIALGSVLMKYQIVIYIFGGFLILTGIKMLFSKEKEHDLSKNPVIRALHKIMPIKHQITDGSFFIKEGGVLFATPLFVTLMVLEFTDIIFAIDSVPAIFAITKEPLIVFTSNIFAILGLRSLYFLLSGVILKFHLLKYGLAFVLIFVGLKMLYLNPLYNGHFPIGLSLGIVFGIIALSVVLSLVFPKKIRSGNLLG